ncbi:hypothetical protein KM043_016651 [Ampulex compressa]|nr:hypothetical protein KM043_016651 [Ampulex compressa]
MPATAYGGDVQNGLRGGTDVMREGRICRNVGILWDGGFKREDLVPPGTFLAYWPCGGSGGEKKGGKGGPLKTYQAALLMTWPTTQTSK